MEDLHDAFGDHVAVDGVDLALAPGEVFGLLGPNGAGRTTTLRVIRGRVSFAQVSTQWGYRPTECSPGEAT